MGRCLTKSASSGTHHPCSLITGLMRSSRGLSDHLLRLSIRQSKFIPVTSVGQNKKLPQNYENGYSVHLPKVVVYCYTRPLVTVNTPSLTIMV